MAWSRVAAVVIAVALVTAGCAGSTAAPTATTATAETKSTPTSAILPATPTASLGPPSGSSSESPLATGPVYAVGDDSIHQTDVPAGLSDTIAISAGGYHSLALTCLLYTSPSPRDGLLSRMPSSA